MLADAGPRRAGRCLDTFAAFSHSRGLAPIPVVNPEVEQRRLAMAQGSALRYEVEEGWEQLPSGYVHRDVAGVATDSEDRVFLICRGDHPVIVYDRKGNFLSSWGEGEFTYRTHGITIGPDGTVFCTDDGNHTVRQFSPTGKLLMTLGTMNTPSDTG